MRAQWRISPLCYIRFLVRDFVVCLGTVFGATKYCCPPCLAVSSQIAASLTFGNKFNQITLGTRGVPLLREPEKAWHRNRRARISAARGRSKSPAAWDTEQLLRDYWLLFDHHGSTPKKVLVCTYAFAYVCKCIQMQMHA